MMGTLTNFLLCCRKVFIDPSKWMVEKESMKYTHEGGRLQQPHNEEHQTHDYKYAKKVWEDCGLQSLGKYHDLYVQSNTILLAELFKSYRNKYLEIYELDLAGLLSAPRLA